jgi:PAS domain-containing protein
MRTSVNLSDVPELEKHQNNIYASLNGNYSRASISIYDNSYDFQFFPIRDEIGLIQFCMGIGFNVTEREEFEKQLVLQRAFLDKIFAESQIPQVVIDINGKINRANIKYYQIAGVTPEKLFETSIYDKDS